MHMGTEINVYVDVNKPYANGFQCVVPFSRHNYFLDFSGVYRELLNFKEYKRLSSINQLHKLIPPNCAPYVNYPFPYFYVTRMEHSVLAGILMELILIRNGVIDDLQNMVVCTNTHDIATSCGGDAAMRIDPKLGEEVKYASIMTASGIADIFQQRSGFDLQKFARIVSGHDPLSVLLDIVDRISYLCLDVSLMPPNSYVKTYAQRFYNFVDIWKEVVISGSEIYFKNPARLFEFCMIRTIMFCELYRNPDCRVLECHFEYQIRRALEENIFTCDDLLRNDDCWLLHSLALANRDYNPWAEIPGHFCWKYFMDGKEQENFYNSIGKDQYRHKEIIKPVNTCLDWKVLYKDELVPLRKTLTQQQIEKIETIANANAGYYVHFKKQK